MRRDVARPRGDGARAPTDEAPPAATISRRRARRLRPPRSLRATRAGWCFIAIIFGVGFAALNTGNNLLYLVLAGMLGFLVLSGLLSEASLRGIHIERRRPGEVHADAEGRIVLRVRNDQRRVAAFAVSIADQIDEGDTFSEAGRTFALRVGPGETIERSYLWHPTRRGDHRFARFRVSTRFPFGLFVKSLELEAPTTALAYPAIAARAAALESTVPGTGESIASRRTPSGDDVAGLREFVAGDSMGRVQWRRSLRSGRLLVGERDGETAGELEVLLRFTPGASAEEHEASIVRAASDVVHHLDAGLLVGLRTATTCIPAAVGRAHRAEILTCLARLDVDATLESQQRERTEATGDGRTADRQRGPTAPIHAGAERTAASTEASR